MATLSMLRAVPGLYGGGFARILDVQYVPSTGGTGSSRDSRTALVRMERVSGAPASSSATPAANSFESELAQFGADNSASPLPISLLAGNNITVLQSLPQQTQVESNTANGSSIALPPLGPQLPPLGEQAKETNITEDEDGDNAQRSDRRTTQDAATASDQAAQEAAQALFDKLFGDKTTLGSGLQLQPITVSMSSLGLGDMEDILLPANLRSSSLQALSAYSVASSAGSTSSSSAIALTA